MCAELKFEPRLHLHNKYDWSTMCKLLLWRFQGCRDTMKVFLLLLLAVGWLAAIVNAGAF